MTRPDAAAVERANHVELVKLCDTRERVKVFIKSVMDIRRERTISYETARLIVGFAKDKLKEINSEIARELGRDGGEG